MDSRWFIVPQITVSHPKKDYTAPKYADRVDGYVGIAYNVPSDWKLPFSGWHYCVRYHAPIDILDGIDAEADTYSRQSSGVTDEQIAEFMNAHNDLARTFSEWDELIGIPEVGE